MWMLPPVFDQSAGDDAQLEYLEISPPFLVLVSLPCCYLCPTDYKDVDKSTMKPLLFPCSVLRRETLPVAMEQAGIPLQCLTCYNTVAHPDIAENTYSLFQSKVWSC